ncbi:hypothetical protein GDO78_001104 [Eleutherodactylus coqui]|uniref:Uncharacterized protein n=1 Tax=Eleutherodactylus coqui TaxID=57060 RepID=A0A8J6KGG9_ELECQ|nr:hypothetical protein GDO78_001104 [Eleutherodactylus coqui]
MKACWRDIKMNVTECKRKHLPSGSTNISSRFASTSMIFMRTCGMGTILSPFWKSCLVLDFQGKRAECVSTACKMCRLLWTTLSNVR